MSYFQITKLKGLSNTTLEIDPNGNAQIADGLSLMAQKVTTVGDITYVARGQPGTAEATAAWQAYKVTVSGNDTTITWADGDTLYNNVATDLSALTYS